MPRSIPLGTTEAQQEIPRQHHRRTALGGARRQPETPEVLQGHEGADRGGGRVSPGTLLQRNKHHRPIAQ